MKNYQIIAGFVGVALLLTAAPIRAAGPLQPPPGPPAPSMKSLDEIYSCFEKRTRITSLPTVISADGSYFLDADLNIVAAGANGITLAATVKKAAIDLGGRSLSGLPGTGHGIDASAMTGGTVAVRNGTLSGFGGDGVRAPACRVLAADLEIYDQGGRGIACGDDSEFTRILSKNSGGTVIQAGARMTGTGLKITGAHGKGVTCTRDLALTQSEFRGCQLAATECPAGSFAAKYCFFDANADKCIAFGGLSASVIDCYFTNNPTPEAECVECPQGNLALTNGWFEGNAGICIQALSLSMTGCGFKANPAGAFASPPPGPMPASPPHITHTTFDHTPLSWITTAGDGGIVSDCTFSGSNVHVANGVIVTDSTFSNSDNSPNSGLVTGDNCSVTNCTVTGGKKGQGIAGNGIEVGANSLVKNCVVGKCEGHGIVIQARCLALQNVVCNCGITVATNAAGIRCESGPATIDGNSTTQNDIGIDLAGTGTTVTRNKISLNTTAIQGTAGNDVAPSSPAATATNPFSNFP